MDLIDGNTEWQTFEKGTAAGVAAPFLLMSLEIQHVTSMEDERKPEWNLFLWTIRSVVSATHGSNVPEFKRKGGTHHGKRHSKVVQ